MQQLAKNHKINPEVIVSLPIISLPKDLIQHRPAPRKILSRKQKFDNLETCIKNIKTSSKDIKNSKDSQKHNSKHNNEIMEKAEDLDKNAKLKKKRGRRGRKKIIKS